MNPETRLTLHRLAWTADVSRDQFERWRPLIEFAESSRRARAAEKAAGKDHGE